MIRKVVAQGVHGRTVFLPIKWVRKHKLEAGDDVEITELENSLLISCEKYNVPKEHEITIQNNSETVIRLQLNNEYRMGYDKVIVRYSNKIQARHVKNIVHNFLIGFEISEERENVLVIESIVEAHSQKYKTLLKKMFLLSKLSIQQIVDASEEALILRKEKKEIDSSFYHGHHQEIVHMTHKLGQYDNLCRRNVNQWKFTEQKSNQYWGLLKHLLLIQHSILHLSEQVSKELSVLVKSKFSLILSKIIASYDLLYQGYIKEDMALVEEGHVELRKILYKEILIDKIVPSFAVQYYLGELSRLCYITSSPIFAIITK